MRTWNYNTHNGPSHFWPGVHISRIMWCPTYLISRIKWQVKAVWKLTLYYRNTTFVLQVRAAWGVVTRWRHVRGNKNREETSACRQGDRVSPAPEVTTRCRRLRPHQSHWTGSIWRGENLQHLVLSHIPQWVKNWKDVYGFFINFDLFLRYCIGSKF